MADFTPVGNQFQPPDPLKGVNTFSAILGIKQRQQALQTGQYLQQSAQANAATAQRDNAQNQALSQVDWKQFQNEDGSWDTDKIGKTAVQVAPNTGADFAQRFNSMMQGSAETKKAFYNLSKDRQNDIRSTMGSWAADPNAKKEDLVSALNNQVDNADEDSKKHLYQVAKHSVHMIESPNPAGGQPRTLDQQKQMALGFSRAGLGAESQSGPGGLATPIPGDQNVGSANLPTATSRVTGARTVQPGGVRIGLAPTDQPAYKRAAAAATTEGGAGAANDEALYNTIQQKGADATKIKSMTQDIRALSHEVQTGQFSKAFADKWAAAAQTFGFPPGDTSPTTRRQILSKMAAQLQTTAESSASTDSERAGIHAALPDPEHMAPAAVDQAARYVGAQQDVNAARAAYANSHRQTHGGASTGLRDFDTKFMSNADPRVFEYQQIPAGAERQQYLKQHFTSKKDMLEFLDKQKAMKGYGVVQ